MKCLGVPYQDDRGRHSKISILRKQQSIKCGKYSLFITAASNVLIHRNYAVTRLVRRYVVAQLLSDNEAENIHSI